MHMYLGLWAIFLIGSGMAIEVPFVYDHSSSGLAGYSSETIEEISAQSSDLAGVPMEYSPDRWDYQDEFDAKIEPSNPIVRQETAKLNQTFTGDPNIYQVCSIYERLRKGDSTAKGWHYINDPRGMNWAYANESLQIGQRVGYVGAGDCDDFAIVMSALVESIGGTSRIVLGKNPVISHAFAEVYLGQDNYEDSKVLNIIHHLMNRFETDKIYVHVDTDTKDVWLNLDWSADHPGGPFYNANEYYSYSNRDQFDKTSLDVQIVSPGRILLEKDQEHRPGDICRREDGRLVWYRPVGS